MIVDELIKELQTYPEDWEVMLEVHGQEAIAQSVNMETGGIGIWVMVSDRHVEKREGRRTH